MKLTKSELKSVIKECLVEEALENGWPKKAKDVVQPALIKPKKISAAFKKVIDAIEGDYSPIGTGNSYIEAIVNNDDFDSKTPITSALTEWLNVNAEDPKYGSGEAISVSSTGISISKEAPVAEKRAIAAATKGLIDQTNYIILGEKFSKISTLIRDSWSGKLYKTTFYFMASEEIVTNQAKMDHEAAMADEPIFLLGYWSSPYSNDREYYWAGPFDDRKEALARGKSLQKNGQPKTFRDWAGGGNQAIRGEEAFRKKAKAAGLNIRENI